MRVYLHLCVRRAHRLTQTIDLLNDHYHAKRTETTRPRRQASHSPRRFLSSWWISSTSPVDCEICLDSNLENNQWPGHALRLATRTAADGSGRDPKPSSCPPTSSGVPDHASTPPPQNESDRLRVQSPICNEPDRGHLDTSQESHDGLVRGSFHRIDRRDTRDGRSFRPRTHYCTVPQKPFVRQDPHPSSSWYF